MANDLSIDSAGRIYFSDPHYYDDPTGEILELDVEAVYRVNPDGSELVRVLGEGQVVRPTGVELSLDERLTGRRMLAFFDALRPADCPPADPRRDHGCGQRDPRRRRCLHALWRDGDR